MKCTFCGTKHTSGTCCGFCGMTFSKDQSLVSPNEFPKSREAINTPGGHKHTQTGCETYGRPTTPPRRINPMQQRKTSSGIVFIVVLFIIIAIAVGGNILATNYQKKLRASVDNLQITPVRVDNVVKVTYTGILQNDSTSFMRSAVIFVQLYNGGVPQQIMEITVENIDANQSKAFDGTYCSNASWNIDSTCTIKKVECSSGAPIARRNAQLNNFSWLYNNETRQFIASGTVDNIGHLTINEAKIKVELRNGGATFHTITITLTDMVAGESCPFTETYINPPSAWDVTTTFIEVTIT